MHFLQGMELELHAALALPEKSRIWTDVQNSPDLSYQKSRYENNKFPF